MPGFTEPHNIQYPTAQDAIKSAANDSALALRFKELAESTQNALTQETQKLGTALYYRGILPTGTDLNTLSSRTDNGIWDLSGSNTYTNVPFTGAGKLTVMHGGIGAGEQRAVKYGSYAEWVRGISNAYASPKTWTEWERLPLTPANRGALPSGANLDEFHLVAQHHGTWSTLSADLGTYTGWPFPGEQGILTVEAGANGAAVQKAYPYAKNSEKRRTLTSISRHEWTRWDEAGASSTAVSSIPDYDPGAPLESAIDKLTMFGDSLTHAGGIAGRLQELLPGVQITNRGVSGQTASQIAGRQGAVKSLITVEGDKIPANGPVAVTSRSSAILAQTGYVARTEPGRLAGVNGVLSNNAGSVLYTFTRDEAGDAVDCPPNTPFYPEVGKQARREAQIIWAGRNNPETGVVPYVMEMTAYLSPAYKRFLVISVTNTPSEVRGTDRYKLITSINDELRYRLGERFVDLRRWLIDSALSEMGITPKPDDLEAVSGDAVPPSLTSDGVHFTASAQRAIAEFLHPKLVALGL